MYVRRVQTLMDALLLPGAGAARGRGSPPEPSWIQLWIAAKATPELVAGPKP